jgi:gamma-glutamyl hercynylcysteine S-oxide hydrolase
MCRHLAYLGDPVSLQDLIISPPHSLYKQSYEPRLQTHGVVNADGFGAGWYVPGRPEPVRYRRAQPIWNDQSFASLAPTISVGCALAAVRDATVGFGADESCAAPFTHDRWLFSHNGAVGDPMQLRKALQHKVAWVPDALAAVDSVLLFGLAVAAWTAGASLGEGLAAAVREAAPVGGGRLSLLATDGVRLAAVTWDEPHYALVTPDRVVLASEPHDDSPGWTGLPDRSMVEADRTGIVVQKEIEV